MHPEHKREAYAFSFTGLVTNVEEFLVPKHELIDSCQKHNLEYRLDYSVRDVWADVEKKYNRREKLVLNDMDWQVLDLYRAYIFQRVPLTTVATATTATATAATTKETSTSAPTPTSELPQNK
jgi:hypothetical protein